MLLFDFDGTLADTFLLGSQLINEYADRFGYQRIDFEKNKDKSAGELMRMAKVRWWEIPRLLRFFRSQTVARAPGIEAAQGIPELVLALHAQGVPMGVLSTNSQEIIGIFLKKYNIGHCFSYFKTGVSLFGKKRALRQARRRLGRLGLGQITYIGDELRDIDACRAAGIPVISCAWGFNSLEALKAKNPKVAQDCTQLLDMIMESCL